MEQIPIDFSMDNIRARLNSSTFAEISRRNSAFAEWYVRAVADYDLNHQSFGRPKPPALLIPVMRDDGYLWPLEDPSGSLVCDVIPPPAEPPKLPTGLVAIGDLFPGDPQKRRACLWNDTAAAGTKVTVHDIEYVKVEIPNPFSGKVHWYAPVA